MKASLSAHNPGLSPPVSCVTDRSKAYSNFSLNKCLFVSVCLLCFCRHLHSCCFIVLVLCCSGGCLLCMLCFLHELFPLNGYGDVPQTQLVMDQDSAPL